MQFIDWISIHQSRHPGSLPLVAAEYRSSVDMLTGEVIRESLQGVRHQGSFDSSLLIRSDGSSVALSGNPSAYDRPDNLYGYLSVQSCVDAVNVELAHYGLPGFDSCRSHESLSSAVQWVPAGGPGRRGSIGSFDVSPGRMLSRSEALASDERARISRVDLTENFQTENPALFLRHISTYQHRGKPGNLYPNGHTVDWGGSRRVYTKYYNKAVDIQNKINKLLKARNELNSDILESHIDYLTKILVWCNENGIVRRETSFKSTELIDRKLTHIEDWSIETMDNIIRPYQFHEKLRLDQTTFTDIKTVLMEFGISERVSRQAELIHCAWIQGRDYKSLCGSRPNYYRYRRALLLVGVDIANPCDISRITVQAHKAECKPISAPNWYKFPSFKQAA